MHLHSAKMWSVVCVSATAVSNAKVAEPVKMLFGSWTRVGLRNHESPRGQEEFLEGVSQFIVKYREY